MRLIGEKVLTKSGQKHAEIVAWLEVWKTHVEAATWNSLRDVRKDYPNADGVKLKSRIVVTVFNVKGNEYRLLTVVSYRTETVQALEVLTHAEYSKNQWKKRY